MLSLVLPLIVIVVFTPGLFQQVSAQVGGGFDLTWSTSNGGGQNSLSGGAFSLSSTIGQPDAANLSGGTFSMVAGFWGVGDATVPTLSINDVSLAEGNSGTTSFVFTVTLSEFSSQTVTVSVETAPGTATAPSDYTTVPSTQLSFSPGTTTQTVTVLVNGDTLVEPAEQFFVNLSGATNATIADAQGIGTILDDDGTPTATPTGTLLPTATPTPTPAPPEIKENKEDNKPKRTEEQRQNDQHTNTGNRDDVFTEGNVVEVHQDARPPYVLIANRDGVVTVLLFCGDQCPTLQVGDYLEADGVKQNEQLFEAEEVNVTRNGSHVR